MMHVRNMTPSELLGHAFIVGTTTDLEAALVKGLTLVSDAYTESQENLRLERLRADQFENLYDKLSERLL